MQDHEKSARSNRQYLLTRSPVDWRGWPGTWAFFGRPVVAALVHPVGGLFFEPLVDRPVFCFWENGVEARNIICRLVQPASNISICLKINGLGAAPSEKVIGCELPFSSKIPVRWQVAYPFQKKVEIAGGHRFSDQTGRPLFFGQPDRAVQLAAG